ncbi:matrixin family metalloprotease [Armatimonas sp.]|uniref:matrixin family metalloprotease n=1 Tax=Armatimonas sp. TaxID=1872638 RepID=UPI0037539D35
MRRYFLALAISSAIATTMIGCAGSTGGNPVTPTAVPTATPVPTPTPTATPTPAPSRSYQLVVVGARGSVPLAVNGVARGVVPGIPSNISTLLSGSNLLSAPATYGDRTFIAWQRNGANFSTAPALNTLPNELANSDTITALYGPGGTRSGLLTPNYNKTDYSFWPSAKLPLKIFFDASVSADQKTLMIEGIERWTKALGSGITYNIVSAKSDAMVVLEMGAVAIAVGQTTTTTSSATPPKPLISATITFDPVKIPALTTQDNRDIFVALVAHEFGHALGINGGGVQGHSDDPNDIMHQIVSIDSATITLRDFNTMMNIYDFIYDGRHRPVSRAQATGERVTQTIACNVRWH